MRPEVGSSKPASIRISVVLPQPEAPSSAKNSRLKTLSDRSSTAVKSPNIFVTFSKEMKGLAAGSFQGANLRRKLPKDSIPFPYKPERFQLNGTVEPLYFLGLRIIRRKTAPHFCWKCFNRNLILRAKPTVTRRRAALRLHSGPLFTMSCRVAPQAYRSVITDR